MYASGKLVADSMPRALPRVDFRELLLSLPIIDKTYLIMDTDMEPSASDSASLHPCISLPVSPPPSRPASVSSPLSLPPSPSLSLSLSPSPPPPQKRVKKQSQGFNASETNY